MSRNDRLIGELPVLQRLALAYAPQSSRDHWLGLLALDSRLATILRAAREPMLAQLRLAWWREQLRTDPSAWPEGEPLLALLKRWEGRREALVALVDGWEAMTGAAPLPANALLALAEARGAAFAALAEQTGAANRRDAAARLGRNWAVADLAARLSDTAEQRLAGELAQALDWSAPRLSGSLRPLAVLHGLAARSVRGGGDQGLGTMLAALRLGLLGR